MKRRLDHASTWRIGLAMTLLLALVLVPFWLLGGAFAPEAGLAGGAGGVAAGGFALLALDAFLPVPSSVVATSVGAAAGAWPGTLVNAAGLTAGCLLGLAAGRAAVPVARPLLGERLYPAFAAWVARYGIAALLLCRAVPVLAEASLFALGAGRARLGPLVAAAALADLCLGAVYAFAGGAAAESGSLAPAASAALGLPTAAGLLAWWMARRAAALPAAS